MSVGMGKQNMIGQLSTNVKIYHALHIHHRQCPYAVVALVQQAGRQIHLETVEVSLSVQRPSVDQETSQEMYDRDERSGSSDIDM